MSDYKPFPPMRKDETTTVDYKTAKAINNSCQNMQAEIKHLQAQLVERDLLIKTLGTGIEIVLFTPDLPLMKCEIEGLRKAEALYKEWKTK